MDWGSVFASGLLGTAKAAESLADDQIKLNQADQAMLRRLQLEDQMAQQKSQREASAMDAAYQRGDQAGQDRRFAKFVQDVGPGDVDREQLKQVFTEYYDNIEGRYTDPESTKARDVLNAARTSGVSTQGLTSLRDEYKSALTTEQQSRVAAAREEKDRLDREQRDRITDMRDNQFYAKLDADSAKQDKSLAAMAARQSARGGADGKAPETERISVLKDVYGKMIANMPQPSDFKDAFGKIDRQAYEASAQAWEQTTAGRTAAQTLEKIYRATGGDEQATAAAIADVKPPAKTQPTKAEAAKKAESSSTVKDNPATKQGLPPGMVRQVGTSGGKPVYEDAKGNRFIAR